MNVTTINTGRQAIVTKYLGPTNARGSRIKACCEAASATVAWDHGLGAPDNHAAACKALVTKLGWPGTWLGGQLPDGTYAYVSTGE